MLVYGEQPVLPQLFFKDLVLTEPAVPTGLEFLFKVSHTICNLKRQFFQINPRISPNAPDRDITPIDYAICYVRLPRKRALAPRYKGPALIIQHEPPTYLVQFYDGKIVRVNSNKIKPVHGVPAEDFEAFVEANMPTAMLEALSTCSLAESDTDDLDPTAYNAPLAIDWDAPMAPLVDLALPIALPDAAT